MQGNITSYWIDHFETLLLLCSHIPHVWTLRSPKYLRYLPPWGNQQLSVTHNLSPLLTLALLHAMCICTIYSLYLGKICCFNFFFPPGKISTAYASTSGSTDGENFFLQWKSWRIQPNDVISKPTFQVTLTVMSIPAHPLWQPMITILGLGFHCCMPLCATASQDSLHWIVTSFPALKNSSSEISIASNRTDAKTQQEQFLCQSKNLLLQVNSWLSFISWDGSLLEGDEEPL